MVKINFLTLIFDVTFLCLIILTIVRMYTQLHKWLPEVYKQKFTHPPSYK